MTSTTAFATSTVTELVNTLSGPAGDLVNKVTGNSRDLWLGALGINLAAPTWDVVILFFLVISVLIYSFTLGRDRIVAILISTYLSLAVTTNLPYLDRMTGWLDKTGTFSYQASIFLIVFALLFFALSRSSILQGLISVSGKWWQVILFSVLQVGLLISIILSFLPPSVIETLSDFTKIVFVIDLGRFCWIVLPILALTLIRGGITPIDFFP